MSLKKRIQTLEDLYGGRTCPTCGFDGHDCSTVNPPPVKYDSEDREPKFCPTCGVQTRIVLTWD